MSKSAHMRLISGVFAAIFTVASTAALAADVTPRVKPPAPGPTYLSAADHARLTLIASAVKKKNFRQARTTTRNIEDPIAKSLGEWLYFKAEDPSVRLDAADAFLDTHLDWPSLSRIQSYLEKKKLKNASAEQVLAFFDVRDPVTGEGKYYLARALFETGDKDAGLIRLRDAWINNNFPIATERDILARYGRHLSSQDHASRVDRLLWSRQVTIARRVFSRLTSKDRRMAQARAELILSTASAAQTYSALPEEERLDSGVLLAAVRYFRRRGDDQYAIALAAESPKTPEALRNSSRWWYERQLLMRVALKNGRFADAYKAASHHGLEVGGAFAEAEFNAGWIALKFLNEPSRAETHFLALASAVGTPISLSRAYYWLGRAAEARGERDLAETHYLTAAEYVYSYYGQLAAEKIGGQALLRKFSPPRRPTPHETAMFTSRPAVAALRMLSDLDLDYELMVFAYHVDDQLESPGEYLELAKILTAEGAPHLTVRAGKVAVRKASFTPEVSYPLVYVPEEAKRFVEPAIILGLSRQESEFNPRAYSRAGARGVMQLIPTTAQITARKEGLRYSRAALLNDPIYNMTIGSAHLSHLLERFDGSLILTFAAYNAGPHRADQWIKTYGDPRREGVDPIDWVELIPFAETRNYVQRVLENTQVYRARLSDSPIPGRLSADLERGGDRGRVASSHIASETLASLATALGPQSLAALPDSTRQRADAFEEQLLLASLEAMAKAEQEAAAENAEANTHEGAPVAMAAANEDAAEKSEIKKTKRKKRSRNSSKRSRKAKASKVETKVVETELAAPALVPVKRYKPGEPSPTDNEAADLNARQLSTDWSLSPAEATTEAPALAALPEEKAPAQELLVKKTTAPSPIVQEADIQQVTAIDVSPTQADASIDQAPVEEEEEATDKIAQITADAAVDAPEEPLTHISEEAANSGLGGECRTMRQFLEELEGAKGTTSKKMAALLDGIDGDALICD